MFFFAVERHAKRHAVCTMSVLCARKSEKKWLKVSYNAPNKVVTNPQVLKFSRVSWPFTCCDSCSRI